MKKKLISLLLTAVMAGTMIGGVTAYAAEETETAEAAETAGGEAATVWKMFQSRLHYR